jgi:SAM-dependent methyltransferase
MLKKKNRIQIRSEIISYLRGYYFFPIFFHLYKKKYLDKFKNEKVKLSLKEFKVKNYFFLEKILNYLVRINILNKKLEKYSITKIGLILKKRIGTMYILNSYNNILTNVEPYLSGKINKNRLCNRDENVIGSGLLHSKKFFEPAMKKINLDNKKYVLDIGCGDGSFLKTAVKNNSNLYILGCDLSKRSVKQTKNKIKLHKKKFIFKLNGSKISEIKKILKNKNISLGNNSLISMWFLLHEISNNSKNDLIKYLSQVRKNFPETDLLIGEISKQDDLLLQKHKDISVMPEFYLFHEISGQGLLSKKDFMTVFMQSGYKLKWIINTDKIRFNKSVSDTNFICYLKPIDKKAA